MLTTVRLFHYRLLAVLPRKQYANRNSTFLGEFLLHGAIYLTVFVASPIQAILLLNTDQNVLGLAIKKNYGECLPPNLTDPFFYVIDCDDEGVKIFAALHIGIFVVCSICCIGFIFAAFVLLKQYSRQLSAQATRNHHAFLLSLFLQVT
ncbi:unnamed protein product [Caenorhabditis auriculariae]|uniref:Uncharacterized protein n=1 Tax=Caenorhabditis auriculariae TaxID=2777116 RepID=A0A8S1H505_9PELO|nr:unnamed protein product [Caenorhabditis auriculariae]